MPSLLQHQSQSVTKLLFIGDSGSGKTGALASLAEAGYNLRILDFDAGLDILVNALRRKPNAAELLKRVTYMTLTDKMKAVGGVMLPDGAPTAFSRAMNLCQNWKTVDEDLGPVSTWGDKDILVVDSLTFLSHSCFRFVDTTFQYKDPRQTYGEAQKRIESFLAMLYSDSVKCNVIVNSHIALIEKEGAGIMKGYPMSIGVALSPRIPTYFNTVLQAKIVGAGASTKRVISTVPSGLVDLKTSVLPDQVPAELPLETGLGEYFRIIRAANKVPAATAVA